VTYPYGTLTIVTLLYLATIPLSYRRFEHHRKAWEASTAHTAAGGSGPVAQADLTANVPPPGETRH
jgi:hypothetical protein